MATRVVLNNAEINKFIHSPSGEVYREILRRAKKVESEAKRRCPVNNGRLRSSISTEMISERKGPVARVGTNVNYAGFVHEGTGIFGPRGSMIRPVRAARLVFVPKGGTKPVFAKQVRGQRGVPFLEEALRAAL